MARLLLWIAVALLVAVVLRDRPARVVILVLATWVALPSVAAHRITGQDTGPLAAHPATWLVLAAFATQLVLRPALLGSAVARHRLAVLAGSVFLVGAVWTSLVNDTGGLKLLLDQIVAPMLVFLLLLTESPRRRSELPLLRTTVLVLAAVQAGLAVAQSVAGRMMFYEADYETLYWFNPLKFDRWMGTMDSPLILAYLLCIAAVLAVDVSRVEVRFGLLGLYLVGVLITQSRVGVAVVSGVILYAVVWSRMIWWARLLAAAAVAAGGYILVTSTLVAGFASRLADDTGSADARRRALAFVLDGWQSYLLSGEGLTASYWVARQAGLRTSIESSFLMYVVDVGLVLTLLYFGAQLAIILRYGWAARRDALALAALVAFVLPHTFSALAASNLSGTLLWAVLGMLAGTVASRRLPAPAHDVAAPAPLSVPTSSAVYSPAT